MITAAAMWAWTATAAPTAARIHHRARWVRMACHAPRKATAAPGSTKVGFQMKVEYPMRLADVAASNAADNPAAAPPIVRPIHHTIGMTSRLSSAISATTHRGSPLPSQAAGSRRS